MTDYLDLLELELRDAVARVAAGSDDDVDARRSARFGWLVPAAAAGLAVVVAAGALLFVRHGGTGHSGRPHAQLVRGRILASNGGLLVGNHVVRDLEIRPAALARPAATRRREARRLSRLLDVSPARITTSGRALVIKRGVTARTASVIAHDAAGFPGVAITRRSVLSYPHGTLAAQVLGSDSPGGRSGLEYEYERYLDRGENLQLSIDSQLQRVGQNALAASIAQNGTDVGENSGGAFVAMDPQNGQVYAMGSAPTFNPGVLASRISSARYAKDFGTRKGDPLLNRAIQTAGPTGSTFKVITATAALQSGDWLPSQTYDDTGHFCFPENPTDCLHNSGNLAYGRIDLVKAIQISDDNFFYNLGYQLNSNAPQGGPLQAWARHFGIGKRTGIDLPGELAGNLPTPRARAQENEREKECDDATGPFRGHPKHAPGGCGIAVYPFEYWTAGDNVNTAVGQGDDQVTPLQLATVYSALENGGTIITPHIAQDIQSPNGTVVEKIDPAPKRHLHINPTNLNAIREGLREAAGSPGGTSYDVMGKFPLPVYGKTGTAQYITAATGEVDTAWYACYVPASATSKPIVVIVTVAKGGFGDVAAAPVAHEILSQWFLGHPGSFSDGVEVGDGL